MVSHMERTSVFRQTIKESPEQFYSHSSMVHLQSLRNAMSADLNDYSELYLAKQDTNDVFTFDF